MVAFVFNIFFSCREASRFSPRTNLKLYLFSFGYFAVRSSRKNFCPSYPRQIKTSELHLKRLFSRIKIYFFIFLKSIFLVHLIIYNLALFPEWGFVLLFFASFFLFFLGYFVSLFVCLFICFVLAWFGLLLVFFFFLVFCFFSTKVPFALSLRAFKKCQKNKTSLKN